MLFGSRRILTPLTVEMIGPPDENQQAFEDPLYVPVGPITKARFKNIKDTIDAFRIQTNLNSSNNRNNRATHVVSRP